MALSLKEKISSIIYFATHPTALKLIVSSRVSGYFFEEGWYLSLEKKMPVDKNLEPIPWFTYPSIDFLKDRLNNQMTVFEFGSGNSTLFFAKRVKEVISVETDLIWFNKIKNSLTPNSTLIYFDEHHSENKYSEIISTTNKKFDVIIIDAIERVEACFISPNFLTPAGVIILDNSERNEYQEGVNFLLKSGFKKLDFWGLPAGYLDKSCTTIFYKSNNCLGI